MKTYPSLRNHLLNFAAANADLETLAYYVDSLDHEINSRNLNVLCGYLIAVKEMFFIPGCRIVAPSYYDDGVLCFLHECLDCLDEVAASNGGY